MNNPIQFPFRSEIEDLIESLTGGNSTDKIYTDTSIALTELANAAKLPPYIKIRHDKTRGERRIISRNYRNARDRAQANLRNCIGNIHPGRLSEKFIKSVFLTIEENRPQIQTASVQRESIRVLKKVSRNLARIEKGDKARGFAVLRAKSNATNKLLKAIEKHFSSSIDKNCIEWKKFFEQQNNLRQSSEQGIA